MIESTYAARFYAAPAAAFMKMPVRAVLLVALFKECEFAAPETGRLAGWRRCARHSSFTPLRHKAIRLNVSFHFVTPFIVY